MLVDEQDYFAHYGILRRSGRYPWGSSSSQNVRNKAFLDYLDEYRAKGLSDTEIARGLSTPDYPFSTTQLRAARTIARNQQKQADITQAQRLHNKGMSNVAIGRKMGINESNVRALLNPSAKEKADILITTANMLRDRIDEVKYLDVGLGVENHIGISKEKLAAAVSLLREEGYEFFNMSYPQAATGQETRQKILTPPGTTWSEAFKNRDNIQQIINFTNDGGRSFYGILPPINMDLKRVGVNYKETGGDKADGVIYVRPGVSDVSLGNSRYAQVRIAVGGTHYLKGMAMYKDDLPDGVDLVFNTNKSDTGNKLDAMKPQTQDPDNPFGSMISRQLSTRDVNGKERLTSAMNLVNEEGDWDDWSKNLSSQFLSKQSPTLAKTQLDKTFEARKKEFQEISNLTNPTVRKKLLENFANETDSAAVHLKAASLPRQGTHVILPMNSIKPNQIYAPKFRDGETVVLVRYPHGGTFEIPVLTVNNNHPEAKRILPDAKDAVGIHFSVAERLSGADFDGDTVLVIPNDTGKVKSTPALDGLRNFDPRTQYKGYEGMPKMSQKQKQTEMGKVSNLITDMTIQKASSGEIARAVRHSMVVIDAEKHDLNYRQSAIDNGITQLKAKYQGGSSKGASTLLSRASAEIRVPKRKGRPASKGGPIDLDTGKKVYEEIDSSYVDSKGKVVVRTTKSKKLAETDDANTLLSGDGVGTRMERVYAEHSNKLKAMANEARLEFVNTPRAKYSKTAREVYAKEVESLNAKLNTALQSRPLERQAQILAAGVIRAKQEAKPNMDDDELKKIKFQALNEMRNRTGYNKARVEFTRSEWDAIQAGAISDSRLSTMLDNADMDSVRKLATPRVAKVMSTAKIDRARAMFNSGATRAEIADALGVSLTTLDEAITDTTDDTG